MADLIEKSPTGKYEIELNYCFEVRFGPLVFKPTFRNMSPNREIEYLLDFFLWDKKEEWLLAIEYRENKELNLIGIELASGNVCDIFNNDGLIKVEGVHGGVVKLKAKKGGVYIENNIPLVF